MIAARAMYSAASAAAAPAALVVRAARRGRWSPPPSAAGKSLLCCYVLAVALLEETVYRGPIRVCARRERGAAALATAAGSIVVFVSLHVRRDGVRALVPQLANAASWSVSTAVGRTVRWSVAAHAAYNYAATSLRTRA